ncbi:XRE family transcriptional regulator [Adhaeribacter terreus]|uniref:XRE family transcriptional regulator n=1 Tax=Adhaeribacter terreus TaxID=529703 RepID=A0ABW0E7F6_9BACT
MLSTNLKYLRKRLGITQAQMAEKINIKRSLIGAYEEGRAEPKLSTLVSIARLFGISLDSLITQDHSQLVPQVTQEEAKNQEGKLRVLAITVDQDQNENIELVPQRASAGYLNGYADPEFMEELPKFRLPMLAGTGTYRAFEIAGDSMLPLVSGTVIVGRFVDDWNYIKDGTPCIIVSQREGVVFKRLYNKVNAGAYMALHSDNPIYPPYEVPVSDILEIWEAKAYISSSFPMADLSLSKLSSIVLDLQHEVLKLKKAI